VKNIGLAILNSIFWGKKQVVPAPSIISLGKPNTEMGRLNEFFDEIELD